MGKPRARGAYFADPLLLPRVQEYADEQLSGTSWTSVDDLQFALRDVDGICAAYRKLPVKGRTLICMHHTHSHRRVLAWKASAQLCSKEPPCISPLSCKRFVELFVSSV